MKKIGLAIGLTLAFTASGQAEGTQVEYGPDDVATIVTTYKQDEARFNRDYAGKKFSGMECALDGGQFQAAVLTGCWACRSSYCAGLR